MRTNRSFSIFAKQNAGKPSNNVLHATAVKIPWPTKRDRLYPTSTACLAATAHNVFIRIVEWEAVPWLSRTAHFAVSLLVKHAILCDNVMTASSTFVAIVC